VRAAATSSAATSAVAARGAAPSAPGAAAGSEQFSNLLVGTGNAAAPSPAPVNPGSGSGSDASDDAPASKPAVVAGNATPAQPVDTPPANAGAPAAPIIAVTTAASTGTTATTAATKPAAATPAAATPASATATPAVAAAPSDPNSAQATVPAPLSATSGNAAATTAPPAVAGGTPKSGRNDSTAGTRGAGHTATASDEAAASAGQVTAMPMWLLVQAVPASAQDPSEDSTSNSSDNAAPVLDGTSAATLAAAATPAFVPAAAAANSATAGSPVATAASALTGAVAASGAAAVAAATAISDSGLNSNSQPDGNGNSAAASSDHTGAAATVSNADMSALASLARALPAAAAQSGSVEHSIPVPVSDQNWPRAVAAQVQLIAAANVQNATLRLSPEHLGPVEVHIDVQASQINVSFVAAHAETRSALEQALPTLRAMLAHGGLTLGQAQVQGESRSASQSFSARAHGVFGAAPVEGPVTAGSPRAVGLIDEYA